MTISPSPCSARRRRHLALIFIKFVSAEPLLERIDLSQWLNDGSLQWVIVGGESGVGARKMEIDWARDLLNQADKAGVECYLKQLGGIRNKRGGEDAVIDGNTWRGKPTSE